MIKDVRDSVIAVPFIQLLMKFGKMMKDKMQKTEQTFGFAMYFFYPE